MEPLGTELNPSAPKRQSQVCPSARLALLPILLLGCGEIHTEPAPAPVLEAQHQPPPPPSPEPPPSHGIEPGNPPVADKDFHLADLDLYMVWIERGTFRMGSDLPDAPDNEKPPTLTTLSKGFWLARLETRQSLYEKINGENPSLIKGPNNPVENLAYLDAVEFCRRLTDLESKQGRLPKGHAYRLPSEAQWEFAARGGKERLPEDGPTFAERTWHRGNSPQGSHPAGSKSATVPGLHDMLGNVHEFCHGFHASYPGRHVVDWVGKSTLRLRIARGGSWFSPTSECTPAFRYVLPLTTATGTVGFRVALVDTGRN